MKLNAKQVDFKVQQCRKRDTFQLSFFFTHLKND